MTWTLKGFIIGLTHSLPKNKGLGLLFPYGNAALTYRRSDCDYVVRA